MKSFFLFLSVMSSYLCKSQKLDVNILIGEWRVCKASAAPMVFIFSNKQDGEKGLLKNWNNPSDFAYKTSFTYTITDAPKDSLTGNPAIDENLFLMTTKSQTLPGKIDIQSFLVHMATKDSIGFVLRQGFITPLCKVEQ
ncbi:MAG: hypothetical protein ACXVBH_13550 [Flavisolibacter sp.]